jgi:hypothetical protein
MNGRGPAIGIEEAVEDLNKRIKGLPVTAIELVECRDKSIAFELEFGECFRISFPLESMQNVKFGARRPI